MNENARSKLLPNQKWIRGLVGGRPVVDSRNVMGVWDQNHYPSWYFPADDILVALEPTDATRPIEGFGLAAVHDLVVDGTTVPAAASILIDPTEDELQGRVRLEFDAIDQWFEEDVEVFGHPKNPYARIDVLPSSRHVIVRHGETVIADTTKPTMLYETGISARIYVPPTDVRLDLIVPAERRSTCAYKGFASYHSLVLDGETVEDVAWSYPTPFPEARQVAGMLSFYTNKLHVEVDGVVVTT